MHTADEDASSGRFAPGLGAGAVQGAGQTGAQPAWMLWWLRAAGAYNVLWGAWAVLLPHQFWSLLGMEQPNYIFLWQCIGMIVGVYGVGYWIAARDVARHWPIVLVGLMGKVFGPIGFIDAHFVRDLVPLRFGITLLTNDLVWWVPFGLMLRHAWKVQEAARSAALLQQSQRGAMPAVDVREAMQQAQTSAGVSLVALSQQKPTLVIFLRHLGCTFCREALSDVARQRARIEASGNAICLVHMSDDAAAARLFDRYGLGQVARVSDPSKQLYRAFELTRGSFTQLFGPRLWIRGIAAGLWRRHGIGMLQGDGLQMPGAFVVHQGKITRAFRHADAGDRPDYCTLATAHAG